MRARISAKLMVSTVITTLSLGGMGVNPVKIRKVMMADKSESVTITKPALNNKGRAFFAITDRTGLSFARRSRRAEVRSNFDFET